MTADTHPAEGRVTRALTAVERLANVQMNISLEEWCELSGAILAALTPPQTEPGGAVREAAIAGWNACRKSIYAVCEDVVTENEKHREDTENPPRHHFGRGGMTAAKSIARGFNSMEAEDDDNLVQALDALSATPATEAAKAALRDLLDHVDRETCTHEETSRGGFIWTICDQCGRKWADDQGGFKPHEDAPAVARARMICESIPPTPATEARVDGQAKPDDQWRKLALQFDMHRIDALSVLRGVVAGTVSTEDVEAFLAAPPRQPPLTQPEARDVG